MSWKHGILIGVASYPGDVLTRFDCICNGFSVSLACPYKKRGVQETAIYLNPSVSVGRSATVCRDAGFGRISTMTVALPELCASAFITSPPQSLKSSYIK